MKKLLKFLSNKGVITALSLIVEIAIIVITALYLSGLAWWVYFCFTFLGVIICVYIISRNINPAYKIAWTFLILALPLFGALIYIFVGRQHVVRRVRKRMNKACNVEQVLLNETVALMTYENGGAVNSTGTNVSRYVENASTYPVYANTKTEYFPLGDDFFPRFLEDLENAKKFIFMEYFIIARGYFYDRVVEILKRKASEGVEVKIIYDDFGSMLYLPRKCIKSLTESGIKICPFNKITPSFDMRFNNRTHRKITVIDGNIAYTGGLNIADEYINKIEMFGKWKDTAMRFEGSAVWSFTIMFMSFWIIVCGERLNYHKYITTAILPNETGYVQPLTSGPGKREGIIENALLNMINAAERYCYINTPYLILDNEMVTALCNAAKCGVDVRITMPHIPDKKIVFMMSRSFYATLIQSGVKIYEYTPGFVHAKSIVCDDKIAFIGSCNMDYRSFYLHYECGALLYDNASIIDMRNDYLNTLKESQLVTYEQTRVNPLVRMLRSIIRVFSPLM